jgi:hypothetical protein
MRLSTSARSPATSRTRSATIVVVQRMRGRDEPAVRADPGEQPARQAAARAAATPITRAVPRPGRPSQPGLRPQLPPRPEPRRVRRIFEGSKNIF